MMSYTIIVVTLVRNLIVKKLLHMLGVTRELNVHNSMVLLYYMCTLSGVFFVIFFEHYSLLTTWLQITLFVLHTWVVEKPKIAWQFQTSRSLRVIM